MPAAKENPATFAPRLRAFRAADFEAIFEIDQQCYPREIAYSRRELRWYLRLPGAEAIVAEDNSKVVAFILSAHWDSIGHIITIDVLPEYRRTRVGTALVEKAESRLAKRGITEIELETATNNDAAIAFWKAHGYLSRGILPNYYPGGLSAYAMIKSLEPVKKGVRS